MDVIVLNELKPVEQVSMGGDWDDPRLRIRCLALGRSRLKTAGKNIAFFEV